MSVPACPGIGRQAGAGSREGQEGTGGRAPVGGGGEGGEGGGGNLTPGVPSTIGRLQHCLVCLFLFMPGCLFTW